MSLRILESLKALPNEPGVYSFQDKEGNVIFVGRAKDLKSDVLAKLDPASGKFHDKMLRNKVHNIEFQVVDNLFDAVSLEYEVLKKDHPLHNRRGNDQKKYRFVCRSSNEKFPRIYMTKYLFTTNKEDFIAPYLKRSYIKKAVNFVCNHLEIADCSEEIITGNKTDVIRTCLRRQLKQCLRPCEIEIDSEDYAKRITKFMDLFSGKSLELIDEIKLKMGEYAKNDEFEKAAVIKEGLQALNSVIEYNR